MLLSQKAHILSEGQTEGLLIRILKAAARDTTPVQQMSHLLHCLPGNIATNACVAPGERY